MTTTAARKLTFEEFIRTADEDAAYELVDGRRELLMAPRMIHGSVQGLLVRCLWEHLGEAVGGYLGTEVDFPTIPSHGRRADVVYLAPGHVTPEEWLRCCLLARRAAIPLTSVRSTRVLASPTAGSRIRATRLLSCSF
ncbi:MAG: Uma2 family endonuclease [Armatimonadetes bacterium]|nr:Uma2 family endonuclease [Armatimonadota bacterium]